MGENVLATMEAVRAARGLNPINPFVIDGTGSPFPPLSLEDLAAEAGKQTQQPQPDQPAPEPPVPIRYPQEEIQQEPEEPVYVLMIGDAEASYHGQHVQLSEAEQAAIASIVLRAITANVKAQYQALLSRLPKRVRVQKTRKRKANAG